MWKIGIIHTLIYFDLLLHTFNAHTYIAAGDFVSAFLCGIDVSVSFMNLIFCYLVLWYNEQVSRAINFVIAIEVNIRSLESRHVKNKRSKTPDSVGRYLLGVTATLECFSYVRFLAIPLPKTPLFSVEGHSLTYM
jgi:hypothetical protein